MADKVGVIGIGYTPARTVSPELSYRELIYDAAVRAYADAGIEAKDVQSFITCTEDFNEGISIADEYTPDQLGAACKPVHTVGGDGIHGIGDAYMEILSGVADIVVVEAHSKASNILTPNHILNYAVDPVINRPLGLNPHYIAGLEMNRFLHDTGTTLEECASVVVKNKANALKNPSGCYGGKFYLGDVLESAAAFSPLKELEISGTSDGSFVLVLAAENKIPQNAEKPIWIKGISWMNDTPTLESRDWGRAVSVEKAAERAYKMAGIKNPAKDIGVFEVDDTYAYKELQHMEALNVFEKGKAGKATAKGATAIDGETPVNVSGGSLGTGFMLEATGLGKVIELVLQLRGEAGQRQVKDAKVGLAQSWRGVPTTSSAVIILGK